MHVYWCHNQRMEIINWIPRLRILCWIFWGKEIIYKIKYSGSLPHPDFLGVTISSHVIYCRFLPIFRHLWTTQENQNRLIRSRRICCNWGENFRLSQKENVLDPEKVLILLITCELVSATMSIALFRDHKDLYISSSLFYSSFVIETKPTFLDCVNRNIYSCILSLLKLRKTFWFMN